MKRTTALLTAVLGLTMAAQAQQQQAKYFTELSIGPSIPIGRFAATTNSGNKVAGYAKPGLAAQLTGGYYLKPSYGVLVSVGYATLPQNKQGLKDNFKQTGIKVNQLDCKNWKEVKLMAGGFYVASIGTKLQGIARLTAGFLKTGQPQVSGSGVDTVYMAPAEITFVKEKLPWEFCYQVSAGLRYTLNQKWYALLDAGYFNASYTKSYSYTSYSLSPGSTVPTPTTFSGKAKHSYGAINAMLGVGVNF